MATTNDNMILQPAKIGDTARTSRAESYDSSATISDDEEDRSEREDDLESGLGTQKRADSGAKNDDVMFIEDDDVFADQQPKTELEKLQVQARLLDYLLKKYGFDASEPIRRGRTRSQSHDALFPKPSASTIRRT